jgi:hypothetical protein
MLLRIGIVHLQPLPTEIMCLYVYPPIVARQRAGENRYRRNTYERIELLDAFSMRSVSYQRKVGD